MTTYLLPTTVAPTSYDVRLVPNLETFKFTGEVEIALTTAEATNRITVHAKQLEVHSAQIDGRDATWSARGSHDFLDVDVEGEPVPAGDHVLRFTFTGTHNDDMAGFYRSKYSVGGEDRYLVMTQCEVMDARRIFPCFDEPAQKATFKLTLRAPSALQSLSNTPVESSTDHGDGTTTHVFEATPKMSSYLFAIVVGELEGVSGATDRGVALKVLATPGKVEQCRFALDVAKRALEYLEEYFHVPYPLAKCDLVSCPDFGAGAMENWGLITFRETALLVDDARTSAAGKERVAYVVAHELSHQWFGNLVSPKRWDYLWLNEGFATYVGWAVVDALFPEWGVWETFVSGEQARAMATDALRSSHPVEVPLSDPAEIDQVFDALSYSKGAAVIRQLVAFVTPDGFRRGMKLYLERHAYGCSETGDLWAALGEATGKDVSTVMDTWTRHVGYPVVSAEEAEGGLRLTQNRFLSSGNPTEEENAHLWGLPLAVEASGGGEPTVFLLDARSAVMPLAGADAGVVLNAGRVAPARVAYSQPLLDRLIARVADLGVVDRLGLVSDAAALGKAGMQATDALLALAQAVAPTETSLAVWREILTAMAELSSLLAGHPAADAFSAFQRKLLAPIFAQCGWEGAADEPHAQRMLRPTVVAALGRAGDEAVIAEAKTRFAAMGKDLAAVPGDLQAVVAQIAVANGGRAEFELAKTLFGSTEDAHLRTELLRAAGSTPDAGLVTEYFAWAVDSGEVKGQDVLYAMAGAGANKEHRGMAWAYVRENWSALEARFKNTVRFLGYISTLPLHSVSSAAVADDVEGFFAAHPCPEATMAISQAVEGIRARAAWVARDGAAIEAWLRAAA